MQPACIQKLIKQVVYGLSIGFLCIFSSVASAADQQRLETARKFAPMVWLGPGEIAYPTLPHPFAFDGIDNDEDGCTDLEDADEIRALVAPSNDKGRRIEVGKLLSRLRDVRAKLRADPNADVSKEIAVPKAVGTCATPKPLDQFKLCRRTDDRSVVCGPDAVVMPVVDERSSPEELGLKQTEASLRRPINSIQYWLYYPWDGGHLHDGEHVNVLYSDPASEGEAPRIRALVGAGHLERMANNVLVAEDSEAGVHIQYPPMIPPHVPFLSELGKHASAPDLNCNGRFDLGHDANDLASGSWGIRDVNHAIGKESWTSFDASASFERRPEGLLIERSGLLERKEAYLEACPEFSLGRSIIKDRLHRANGTSDFTYRLVLADTVKAFITLASTATDIEKVLASVEYRNMLGLGPDEPLPSRSVDLRALSAWADGAIRNTTPRPDVWNHRDFADPKRDFRLNLFPRLDLSLMYAVEGANGMPGLSLRTSGWWKLRDSSLEVRFLIDNLGIIGDPSVAGWNRARLGDGPSGISGGDGYKFGGSIIYNAFSTGLSGPYFGFSYRRADYSFQRVYAVPHAVDGPDSFNAILIDRSGDSWNLEAGYSYRLPLALPLSIQTGISGPIYRRAPMPGNPDELRYYNNPKPFEVRISVKLGLWRIVNRKHPLSARDPE